MISEAEYNAIKERVDRGEMPSEEELAQVLEYATAEAKATFEKSGMELTCPNCCAKLAPGTAICEYCGTDVFEAMLKQMS